MTRAEDFQCSVPLDGQGNHPDEKLQMEAQPPLRPELRFRHVAVGGKLNVDRKKFRDLVIGEFVIRRQVGMCLEGP